MDRPFILGFAKVRNENLREGNASRLVSELQRLCDAWVVCDDASVDGTRELLVAVTPPENLLLVPPAEQDFRKELSIKQRMLARVHQIQPEWILWLDADEAVGASAEAFRAWLRSVHDAPQIAWRCHYTQFWRNTSWARTDSDFDGASFLKLWRWNPDLSFEVQEGTHHRQFPKQIAERMTKTPSLVGTAPFEVLHYGNVGKSLVWKCIQYWGGLGGVDRHLRFPGAQYRHVDAARFPAGCSWLPGDRPQSFTTQEIARIEALKNLRAVPGLFCVVIPTYNRAGTLDKALASVVAQTYEQWVAVVVDDGSTDGTPDLMRTWQDRDPRIFYCRFPTNRGGVAVNEVGTAIACEMAAFWTRIGSDDWWEPRKLESDAEALKTHQAVYGPYRVYRHGAPAEICNPPRTPEDCGALLCGGTFVASWANCAVRTEVLRAVRERHGRFADPSLRNCEDYLINARIARLADWVWRGRIQGTLVIGPAPVGGIATDNTLHAPLEGLEPDAVWSVAADGASANTGQLAADEQRTRALITEENAVFPWRRPSPRPPVAVTPPDPPEPVLDATRAFWASAAEYPANKEEVYPEHGAAQEFDLHASKTVLEYGCGGGSDAMSFLRRGCTVWYADVVPGNLVAATARITAAGLGAKSTPLPLEGSVPIPLPDGSCDVISAHGVLHHIARPAPVVAEFARILKPGGLLYVMLYTERLDAELSLRIAAFMASDKIPREQAFGWCSDGRGCPYARAYTEAEGRALLEAAGFRVTRAFLFNSGYFRTFRGERP